MLHFQPTPPRTTRALVTAPETTAMPPARYLRLRREAAGLTRHEVARRLFGADQAKVEIAVSLLASLETPGVRARVGQTLERLIVAFPFDADVYRQLANDPADSHPLVCAGCGCTQNDACVSADGHHTCGWHASTRLGAAICTRCAGEAQ